MKKKIIAGLAVATFALASCGSGVETSTQHDMSMKAYAIWESMPVSEQNVTCTSFRDFPELLEYGFREGYGRHREDIEMAWAAMRNLLTEEC